MDLLATNANVEFIESNMNAPGGSISIEVNETNLEPNPNSHSGGNVNIEEVVPQAHDKELKTLTNEVRYAIYHALLEKSLDGRLKKGATGMVASSFSVSIRTVQRIWKRSKDNGASGVAHRKTKNCEPCALKSNTTSVFRLLKSGIIRRHSNAIKPLLKEENKKVRLEFCLSMLEGGSIQNDPIFKSMHNIVHIDEKWFYMTKNSEKYYLLQDEEDLHWACKSKNFIGKVMFSTALTRPRIDSQGNESFNWKFGVYPFVTQEAAKRTSANRIAGTLETKAITSVKREVIRSFLITKVLPDIKKKWPREELGYPIYIQQDNARTHVDQDDEEFCQEAAQDGFNIRLMCQPPNSSDLNVLDLGFFSTIQSLQHKESPKTIDELVSAVTKSFEDFSVEKSNHIFLTLQLCMIEIMKARGSNKYKIPHINKARLGKEGQLPDKIKCDPILVQDVLNYLSSV